MGCITGEVDGKVWWGDERRGEEEIEIGKELKRVIERGRVGD